MFPGTTPRARPPTWENWQRMESSSTMPTVFQCVHLQGQRSSQASTLSNWGSRGASGSTLLRESLWTQPSYLNIWRIWVTQLMDSASGTSASVPSPTPRSDEVLIPTMDCSWGTMKKILRSPGPACTINARNISQTERRIRRRKFRTRWNSRRRRKIKIKREN